MKKPIAWLCLATASLALSACGGGEPAEDAATVAPAKKKGKKSEEQAVNPWAKDGPAGTEPAEPAKKAAKKKKSKNDEEEVSPWAKQTPQPAAT